MKKIGLLIPTVLCAATPVICVVGCSKGSPTVEIDGSNLIIVRKLDESFTLTFNASKELTEWQLKDLYPTGLEDSKLWVKVVKDSREVYGKKITVKMVAPSDGFTSRPDITLKFKFIFASSKGEETRFVDGITFKYQLDKH